MNKFLSLLLVVLAIAQATAFMGTPVVTQRTVRMLLILRYEKRFGIHRERLASPDECSLSLSRCTIQSHTNHSLIRVL